MMPHPAQLPIDQLLADCSFQRTRRSGPGGQHRNKVETAVVVEHMPSGIRAEANERRSQEQNRQVAIQRLRVRLAIEVRTTPPADVSKLWRSRTTGGKLSVNVEHTDLPAMLAEALDTIVVNDFDLATAADCLGVSSSQLVKFLKLEPAALAAVNRQRQALGHAAYR
jgi:protein subunit release factor A